MSTNGQMKRTSDPQLNRASLQVLSEVVGRLAFVSKLGFSHAGTRDVYKTLGYVDNVTSEMMISQWTRQDVARAVVDRPVKATWSGDVIISEPNVEDESKLEAAYKKLDKELGLKAKLMRADRLAQLGRYSLILLGFDDSSRDSWATAVSGQRELRYIKVVSDKNSEIDKWEQDASNKRYGLPRIYKVKIAVPGEQGKTIEQNIHYSRVIHIAQELLEDDVKAHPIMEAGFNRLKDLEKLVGGDAEMFWRGARPGYAATNQKDYKLGNDIEKNLKDQLAEYENDLRRFITAEGVDINSLTQQIADPKSHVEVQMQMLSALYGIPLRILMGSERGELASSQDRDTWSEIISNRRTEIAEPSIMVPFVDRLLETGVLPPPVDEEAGYSVVWADLFSVDESSQAEISKKYTDALVAYSKEPMAEQNVPFEAFLKYILKMGEDTVEQIMKIRDTQMDEMIAEEDEDERLMDEMEVVEDNPPVSGQNNLRRTK